MGVGRPGPDREAAARAVADLIRALGLDPAADAELEGTPARVASLYAEAFAGLAADPAPDLVAMPAGAAADSLVIARGLPFHSTCVHHFAPFFGHATIAYLPGESLLGISALPRLLVHYARRPQLQERLGVEIADHLERLARPRGVAVVLEARHLCMEMRGVKSPGVIETRLVRGALAEPRWQAALAARSAG